MRFFDQIAESGVGIAFDVKGDDKQRDQVSGIDAILRPLGDLAQAVLGPKPLDLGADDFRQARGQLLSNRSLLRRQIEENKRDRERPVGALGQGMLNDPLKGHENHDQRQHRVELWSHGHEL